MGDIHGKYSCGQCGKKFWLQNELDIHKKNTHTSKCSECEHLFDSEIDLQVHLKETHISETEVLLEDTSELSLEEQSEQSQLGNDLEKCEVCGKEEISFSEMIEHKKTHNF